MKQINSKFIMNNEWFVFICIHNGIKPNPEELAAITNFLITKTIKQILCFLKSFKKLFYVSQK